MRWLAAALLGSVVALCCRASLATKSDGATASAGPVRVVLLVSSVDAERADPWGAALAAHLSDLDAELIVHRLEATPEGLVAEIAAARSALADHRAEVACWAFGPTPTRLRLLVRHDVAEGFEERPLDVGRGGRGGAAESAALVVRSAVVALSSEVPDPVAPLSAAAPLAPPVEAEEPRRPALVLSLHGGYAGELATTSAPLHHGLVAGVGLAVGEHVQLLLSYVVLPAISLHSEAVDLTLERHPMLLSAALRQRVGRFSVGGGLSLCVDPITDQATAGSDSLDLEGQGTGWLVSVVVLLRGSVELWPKMRLWLAAGAETALTQPRYVLELDGRSSTVLEPWALRPVWTAGLELDIL